MFCEPDTQTTCRCCPCLCRYRSTLRHVKPATRNTICPANLAGNNSCCTFHVTVNQVTANLYAKQRTLFTLKTYESDWLTGCYVPRRTHIVSGITRTLARSFVRSLVKPLRRRKLHPTASNSLPSHPDAHTTAFTQTKNF